MKDGRDAADDLASYHPHCNLHHQSLLRVFYSLPDDGACLKCFLLLTFSIQKVPSRSISPISIFFLSFSSNLPHVFFGLPGLFFATTISFHALKVQPMLHSSCPNKFMLQVPSTTSSVHSM